MTAYNVYIEDSRLFIIHLNIILDKCVLYKYARLSEETFLQDFQNY